ncbi:hypothetical protein RHGRI_031748 [Rhododendron griersonianum]|uniref:protein-serine/threonine phosphatase n=1 Tax=Rhododendron griersonianum TaxID=479676 RepID=A0AAV6I947_9ERIC|nr:hypothetical protein RHGRI_031748 [Rhododendron griersonianum]
MNVEDPPPSASSPSTSPSSNSSSPPDVPPFNVQVDPQPTPLTAAEPPPQHQQHQQQPGVLIQARDPDALFSGGGISFLTGHRNASFSYGYSSFKGKRSSMEDFYETSISEVDGQMVAFFGVFDGHGGSRTAEYLKDNLFKNLSSHPDFIKDTKSAIVEAFRQTDADYLNEAKGQQKDAGSTASTAVLLGDRLLVANVGDSRVVACRAGSGWLLSTQLTYILQNRIHRSFEHEIVKILSLCLLITSQIDQMNARELNRQEVSSFGQHSLVFILDKNSFCHCQTSLGTWRVGGVLAVSRAFGDKLLKPYVVAEPEIQEEEIDGVDFIIIASDGLWNVLSNKLSTTSCEIQDAVTIVQDIKDAEAASRKLIQEAYARGSSDNITCVVVRFEKNTRE